jgi:hypothetical protein
MWRTRLSALRELEYNLSLAMADCHHQDLLQISKRRRVRLQALWQLQNQLPLQVMAETRLHDRLQMLVGRRV